MRVVTVSALWQPWEHRVSAAASSTWSQMEFGRLLGHLLGTDALEVGWGSKFDTLLGTPEALLAVPSRDRLPGGGEVGRG